MPEAVGSFVRRYPGGGGRGVGEANGGRIETARPCLDHPAARHDLGPNLRMPGLHLPGQLGHQALGAP